jgi:hypothetical protein
MRTHRTRALRILTLSIGVAAVAGVVAVAALGAPAFPTHRCGSFRSHGFQVRVFNRGTSCRGAGRLIRAFLSPKSVAHGGPAQSQVYWTVPGFPGWRCYQGAGGGDCLRHNADVGFLIG